MQTKLKCSWLVLAAFLTSLTSAFSQGPVVVATDPPTNTVVLELNFIDVVFEDAVTGVDASDLLINGIAATNLTVLSTREYLFNFPQPPTGAVTVAWASGHGITDLSSPPNPFAGGSWGYTLDPNSVSVSLVISEFLSDNNSGIKDEDGAHSDWLELYNPGSVDANLDGWFLTDTSTNLTKWRIPGVFLGAGKYLLVWASGKDRTNAAGPLHTNFKISNNGGYLALVDPAANVVSAFNPYPAQQADVSYGRDRVDPNLLGFFTTPTPGAANSSSGPGFAPDPVFSLDSGIYTNSSLALTISASLGTIRYTTNGTVPVATNSILYTGPINLAINSIIKARVFPSNPTLFPSRVVARTFLFLDNAAANFTSEVPLLIISTPGTASIPQNVAPGGARAEGIMAVIDTFRGRSSTRGTPDFLGLGGFELYGQTSIGFPKPPVRIEIHDELGNDMKASLLGLPADSDWKTRNPFDDKTLLNDFLGYELFDQMGHYSCRRRFVETFIVGGSSRLSYPRDYIGVEVLFETIKQGKDRVNIAEITPFATNEPAITGGYIFKKDKDSQGDINFSTTGGGGFPGEALKIHEPKPNQFRTVPLVGTTFPGTGYTPAGSNQLSYLRNYLNRMEAALYATNWLSLTGTNHYSNYLDVDSFVDFHWVVEFTKQIDGIRLSAFFTKDRGGKVQAGPVWDWNLSFGNANYLRGGLAAGWYYSEQDQGITANEDIWLRRLRNGAPGMGALLPDNSGNAPAAGGDPDFNQKVVDRWAFLRTNVCSSDSILARIDELSTLLAPAAGRDLFGKWRSQIAGVYQWPNPGVTPSNINEKDVDFVHPTNYLGNTTTTNSIIGQMKKWMLLRYQWIDSQFTPQPNFLYPGGVPPGDLNSTDLGGLVPSGFAVTITAPPGAVLYYTLDGSDPRAPGGTVAAGVLSNTAPATITVNSNLAIFARAKQANSWYNSWSGPATLPLHTGLPSLRITEIMYHPAPPPAGNTNDADNFEYLEVKNVGSAPLNLQRFALTDGVLFDFPNVTLGAGQSGVVVADIAAFQSRYGSGPRVLGQYSGRLENAGERVALRGPAREPILDFKYDDKWYPITDGFGFSLVVVDESAPPTAWGTKAQWRPSGTLNGTPGQDNGGPATFPHVVVNEALTHSDPAVDVVELYNFENTAVNLAGWYLTDDFNTPKKYRFPNPTMIPANGYLTVDETAFNVGGNGNIAFALSSLGDELYLFSGDTSSNLTGYFHGFDFGAQVHGATFGRYVTSDGLEHFVTQSGATLGAPNSSPLVGQVVMSEIMYRPLDVYANNGFWNNTEDEYVELFNRSGSPVSLFDPNFPTNTWRLGKGVDFQFPASTTIPAGGYLLVVNFNPALNPSQLAAFRTKYNVPPGVPIVGPYGGDLSNGGETVALLMPDAPVAVGPDTGKVPYVVVEQVKYSDQPPWSLASDGAGFALHRKDVTQFADDSGNWDGSAPTPGRGYTAGPPPTITTQPESQITVATYTVQFSVTAGGPGPYRYLWKHSGQNLPGETNSIMVISNVQPTQAGLYQVLVMNNSSFVASSNANLTVRIPANITQHPQSQSIRAGSNVTFTVSATSSTSISYQWFFNGAPIPGATGPFLTINGVTNVNEGTYLVQVADAVGPIFSSPAFLRVLITPYLQSPAPPLNISAVVGEPLTLGVQYVGTLPVWTRWRLFRASGGGTILVDQTNSASSSFYSFVVNTNSAGAYTVILTNAAGGSQSFAWTNAILTVLTDSNTNGIPDVWEATYFGSPTGVTNRDADSDGDGLSNWEEYRAGTDPTDPTSYLKVTRISPAGGARIEFNAVSNRTYSVEFKDGIDTALWTRLVDVLARGTNWAAAVVDPRPGTNRYYHLVTPKQP